MSRRFFTAKERQAQKAARAKGDTTVPRTGGAVLSLSDAAMILKLHHEGKTQGELAQFFQVNQSTISRVLGEFQDTRPIAKARLHAAADDLAETAVHAAHQASKRGDGSVALELLDRLDVAQKRLPEASSGAKVMVIVGQATVDALPPALREIENT